MSEEVESAVVIQALKSDEKWSNILSQVNKGVQPATAATTTTATTTAAGAAALVPVSTPLPMGTLPHEMTGLHFLSLAGATVATTTQQPQMSAISTMSPTSHSNGSTSPLSAFYPTRSLSSSTNATNVTTSTTNPSVGGGEDTKASQQPTQVWAPWTGVKVLASTALELIDVFFTSGYFPVLHRSPFIRDYNSPKTSMGYCSPALVSAILALSCKRAQNLPGLKTSTRCSLTPLIFYNDASQHLLKQAGQPRSLPDCQAMALLSLYQLSYGDDIVAARLVQDAMEHSMAYYDRTEEFARGDVWHEHVRGLALCGSVTLGRMIWLFIARWSKRNQAATILSPALLNIILAGPVLSKLEANSMQAPVDDEERPMQRLMTYKFFELAEIVQQALRLANEQDGLSAQHRNPFSVHDRCMQWYNSVSSWMPQFLGIDPFAEFLQLFYYFSTLSIWHKCFVFSGRYMISGMDMVPYSSGLCDVASRGIFDFPLTMPLSPYLQSAPYLWPLFINTVARVQLKILHNVRAKPTSTYETMQAVETDTLLRRAYIQSAISRLQGLRENHPGAIRLCREVEHDYKNIMAAAGIRL